MFFKEQIEFEKYGGVPTGDEAVQAVLSQSDILEALLAIAGPSFAQHEQDSGSANEESVENRALGDSRERCAVRALVRLAAAVRLALLSPSRPYSLKRSEAETAETGSAATEVAGLGSETVTPSAVRRLAAASLQLRPQFPELPLAAEAAILAHWCEPVDAAEAGVTDGE